MICGLSAPSTIPKAADPNWSTASTYDLNGDDRIDILDIIIVAVKFGTTYNGPPGIPFFLPCFPIFRENILPARKVGYRSLFLKF